MDRPQNLMMICGVLLFGERLSLARLRKVIGERFVVFKRFRQRPVEMPGVAFWQNDSGLRHRASRRRQDAARRAAGRAELQALVSRLASHAARSGASDVAVPPRRPLRRRQRADRAHPSLLRRRHRAGAGDAVDDRRRAATVRPRCRSRRAAQAGDGDDDDPLAQLLAPLSGVLARRARSARRWSRRARTSGRIPRRRSRSPAQGRRVHRRDREARADAAGLADALQGQAGRRASASRGPSRCRSTR